MGGVVSGGTGRDAGAAAGRGARGLGKPVCPLPHAGRGVSVGDGGAVRSGGEAAGGHGGGRAVAGRGRGAPT